MEKQRNPIYVKCFMACVLCAALIMLPAVSAQAKWVKTNGKYRYTINEAGTKYYKNRWVKIKGKYYYFDKNGYRKTGWFTNKGKKYYLDSKGVKSTGIKTIKKKKYYFSSKGVMITGWIKYKKNYYYADNNGVLKTGLAQIGDNIYYFDSNGRRVSNSSITFGSLVYYFAPNGTLQYNGTPEESAVKYINAIRMVNGYAPLEYYFNSSLSNAALQRAVELDTLASHTRPDGSFYTSVLEKDYPVPYYWSGECILWGKAKAGTAAAKSWLSDANADIFMQKKADAIGIAKYTNEEGCEYWTAIVIQKR